MAESFRRDLELVLLGVALAKESRSRVLGSIPVGTMSREVEQALETLRDSKSPGLLDWLGARDVVLEKGQDVIQVITQKIIDWNRREVLQNAINNLRVSSKVETTDQMLDRVISTLERLKELK